MQTQKNHSISPEEFVIFANDETGKNLVESLKFSQQLADGLTTGTLLYINTVQSEKRLMQTIHENADPAYKRGMPGNKIHYLTNTLGNLSRLTSTFEYYLTACQCKVIVINAWEYCCSDYRGKEQLLYLIRQWRELGITVILYAQMFKREPKAGKIERGGLGKLTGTADQVINLSTPRVEDDELESEDAEATGEGFNTWMYFDENPAEAKDDLVMVCEESDHHGGKLRDITISDYNFPAIVPLETSPEYCTIEEYLSRYRKQELSDKGIEDFVGVQNDVYENQ